MIHRAGPNVNRSIARAVIPSGPGDQTLLKLSRLRATIRMDTRHFQRRLSPCAGLLSLFRCLPVWSHPSGELRREPLVVDLWPGKTPGDVGIKGQETSRIHQSPLVGPTKLITNVTKPTLTIYRPAQDKNTGTAMIICPGGGYWDLYWELEGEEVAAWLNSVGMTGIILKYRCPRRPGDVRGEPAAGPAARRPAGRQPGPQPGRGMGHRPEADRHGRLLGGRPSRAGDRHQFREAAVRTDRRDRPGELPARFRRLLLFGLSEGEGQG